MTETRLTYDKIAPLVASAEVKLTSLYVTFRCQETGTEVVSTARIGEMTPVGGDARLSGHDFDRFREAVEVGTRTLAGDRELPFLGSPHLHITDANEPLVEEPGQLEPTIYRHAVVRAFESVRHRFLWDEKKNRYVGLQG